MVAIVTGAAGFLGSHLVDVLLEEGLGVIGVDNLITGRRANLAHAGESSRFRFVESDLTLPFDILRDSIGGAADVRLVFHLASPASPVDYGMHPLETLRVNSTGTENACRLALEHGAAFLYASTSETYGDPLEHPQREAYWGNVNPVGLRSCYDEGKRYGEAFVTAFARVQNIDARIVRIFNTYGPRMNSRDGRVIPTFVTQAIRGDAITIYGSGEQTRSFCYVSDLVAGIYDCARSPITRGRVINLGNPVEYDIKQVAELVCNVVGSRCVIESRPMPEDDPKRRQPDISLARSLIGWEPDIDLREGLERTVDYFRHGDWAHGEECT